MKRNKFSLSHYKLLTCDLGQLVPVGCVEVIPGDTLQHHTSALVRCSPLIAPVMHPVGVRIHHWFVPHRLVMDAWEAFITGGTDGVAASAPMQTMGATVVKGSLLDYLGLPPNGSVQTVNDLAVRAYNLIFNEFYRDQDLQTPVTVQSDVVQRCAWERDYFTLARPWPQRGPDVTVPLNLTSGTVHRTPADGTPPAANTGITYSDHATKFAASAAGTSEYVDLTFQGAGNIQIDDLRTGFALQKYREARARYGARYTEYLRYLGISPADSRLQRPEYLGGGRQTISFSEVLQTSNDGTNGEVGAMSGHGIAAMRTPRYRKFFSEHGFVMTLMSVRPKTMYATGAHRMWYRRLKEEYWQKELEIVGQQVVPTRELYVNPGSDVGTFGYVDRYEEYRGHPSGVAGDFRDTLNYWHMGRIFASAPALNPSFINCDPGKRNFAEQTANSLWIMVNHRIGARRMVSKVGTPGVR